MLGRNLLPMLVADGHRVAGMTRSPDKAGVVEDLGATPVVADALDPLAVADAIASFGPEVVVHQLTDLSAPMDLKRFDRWSAATNRLRVEATDNLLAAGRRAGVRRFVAQSYVGPMYARSGGEVKTEEDPLDGQPLPIFRDGAAAIRHLEQAVTSARWTEGVVLRYGSLYGPGTATSRDPDAGMVRPLMQRRFPILGNGQGVWSFVHVRDAAAATRLAVERGEPGIYNVVDDEPAAVAEWLPFLAAELGAKPPRRLPLWLGKRLAGPMAALLMTEVRGASNAKARRQLGWRPEYPSWRQGFRSGLG